MKQLIMGFVFGLLTAVLVWSSVGGEVHAQWRDGARSVGGVASGPPGCAGDLNNDGEVNGFDLVELLSNWGPCPCAGTMCGSQCVDLDSDDDHCGSCNSPCTGGTVCEQGQCVLLQVWYEDADGDGWGNCDEYVYAASPPVGYVSTCGDCDDTDPTVYPGAPEFCNGIDNDCDGIVDNNVVDCPTGSVCDCGSCVSTCGVGETDCNGTCVNLSSHTSHCGGCGNTCPSVPNSTTTCSSGMCGFFCNPGWGDCDGNFFTGCEVNLTNNVNNCGACGNTCPNRPNSTRTCVNSVCGFVCNSGWADCNGSAADGCEVNLNTNNNHCGTCGNQCPVGTSCVSGAC